MSTNRVLLFVHHPEVRARRRRQALRDVCREIEEAATVDGEPMIEVFAPDDADANPEVRWFPAFERRFCLEGTTFPGDAGTLRTWIVQSLRDAADRLSAAADSLEHVEN